MQSGLDKCHRFTGTTPPLPVIPWRGGVLSMRSVLVCRGEACRWGEVVSPKPQNTAAGAAGQESVSPSF